MGEQREVIIKDVDVEAAIEEGLQILNSKREEVEIEVIEKGKKGFLGFGSSLAKVRIALKANSLQSLNNQKEDKQKGSKETNDKQTEKIKRGEEQVVYLEEDQLKLSESVTDRYPIIYSDNKVNLYKNGILVNDSIIMVEDDEVRVEVKNEEPLSEIKLRTTADRLEAYIMIVQEPGVKFAPEVIPNSNNKGKTLIAAEKEGELEPPKIRVEDIERKLDEANIIYGIKREVIAEVLANPNREFLIAKGKTPHEGQNGYIDYLFQNKSDFEVIESDNSIDYFSLNQITSVERGEVIAKKYPPSPGEPGLDIFGDQIEIDEVEAVQWQIGEGVKIIEDKAIATKPGRPIIDEGELYISETYIINGDVNNSTGNIDFSGNVIVKGNVEENFSVKAGGKIEVLGNVNQATLNAGDGITVFGNTVGSELKTGELSAFYKESYFYLKKLNQLFAELEKAINQLCEHKSFKTKDIEKQGFRKIFQLLLDTKYTKITKLLRGLYKITEQINLSEALDELEELLLNLKQLINKNGLCKINDLHTFIKLKENSKTVQKKLAKFNFEASNIVVKYIQNSQAMANGNIIVDGKGVYNSHLNAGGHVKVSGSPGCVRGGEIRAKKDVFIRELGSPKGSKVSIYVPQEERIKADQVHVNVLLNIGGYKYRFQKNWENISAHINNEKNIVLI